MTLVKMRLLSKSATREVEKNTSYDTVDKHHINICPIKYLNFTKLREVCVGFFTTSMKIAQFPNRSDTKFVRR